MRQFIRMLSGSLLVLIVMVAVILAWSILIGWVLTLILPFELFEGSLLAIIASGIVFVGLFNSNDASDGGYFSIPLDRFVDTPDDMTWENWVRYNLANVLHEDFSQHGNADEDVATQVADAVVEILKRRGRRASPTITASQLQRRLDVEIGDMLDVAVNTVNDFVVDSYVETVMEQKSWNKPLPGRID